MESVTPGPASLACPLAVLWVSEDPAGPVVWTPAPCRWSSVVSRVQGRKAECDWCRYYRRCSEPFPQHPGQPVRRGAKHCAQEPVHCPHILCLRQLLSNTANLKYSAPFEMKGQPLLDNSSTNALDIHSSYIRKIFCSVEHLLKVTFSASVCCFQNESKNIFKGSNHSHITFQMNGTLKQDIYFKVTVSSVSVI